MRNVVDRHRPGGFARVAAGAFLAAAVGAPSVASAQLQEVVIKGSPSPEGGGSVYRSFKRPAASDLIGSRTVFEAKIKGGAGSRSGLFFDDPAGGGSTVVLSREIAPNGQGFRRFRKHPSSNTLAEIAWHSTLTGSGRGIFQNGPANVDLVGDGVPAPANGSLQTFFRPIRADNGATAFYASISGGSIVNGIVADEGIFRCNGGDFDCTSGTGVLETVVIKGDLVPDRPGRSFCDIEEGIGASSLGVAFRATTQLDCTDLLEIPLTGVFRWSGGAIETIAMQTEQAQPFLFVGGTTYGNFSVNPAMANDGSVVFVAETAGVVNTHVIYRCDAGACPALPATSIVLAGDTDGVGNTVSTFFTGLSVADTLDVAFHTRVTDINSRRGRGIYVYRDATASLERIASKEDIAPGVAPGIYRRVYAPDMSSMGRIAFRAKVKRLAGGSVTGIYLFE